MAKKTTSKTKNTKSNKKLKLSWWGRKSKNQKVLMVAGVLAFGAIGAYYTIGTFAYGFYSTNALIFGDVDLTRFQNSKIVTENNGNKKNQRVIELVNDNGFTGPNDEYPVGPGELIATPYDTARYRDWLKTNYGEYVKICMMARGITGSTAVEFGLLSTPATGTQWSFVSSFTPKLTTDYTKYCGKPFQVPSLIDPTNGREVIPIPYVEYNQQISTLNGDKVRIGSIIIEKSNE